MATIRNTNTFKRWLWIAPLAIALFGCSKFSSGDGDDGKKSGGDETDAKKQKKKKGGDKDPEGGDAKPAVADKPSCDGKSAVEAQAKAFMAAVVEGNADAVKEKLFDMVITPDEATTFFTAMYGDTLGPKVSKGWEDDVFAELPALIRPFKQANEAGQTEIVVLCVDSSDNADATGLQKAALNAMKTKTALYTVKFVKPGETSGSSLWSFASAGGGVKFLGEMKQVQE